MADVLFWRIQFTASNPFGEFVADDILEFYYDNTAALPTGFPDSTGVTVYKNDVLIASGADIAIGGQSYIIESSIATDICNGTTAISPSRLVMAFPYFTLFPFPDFPSCAVNPPTCDLIVVGTPIVTPATGENAADGEIEFTAQSSEDIQYRLGSDFTYDDGNGTAAPGGVINITGLLPGQYRVYLRDALNCAVNVLLNVDFSEDYGVLNRLEFDSLVGHVAKIEITKFAYSSTTTEVIGANVAFTRSLEGAASENKFESVLATKAVLGLTSETNFQFQSLFTNNPEEYRLNFYRDNVLKGIYKVLPQQYEEDYKAAPYYVKVVAICGLASLKEIDFINDDGQRFNGSMKAIEVIAFILKKARLHINIRVAINLYATDMDSTASDDPLDQAYVDTDTYYINNSTPSCEYVLRQIIEPFGARILQENAVWNILRVEELVDDYDYREFNEDGVYVSNSNYDPIVSIVNPTTNETGTFLSDRDHYLKTCPGYGKVRLFYKLGLRENIFENGDFRLKYNFIQGFGYQPQIDTFGWQLVQNGSQVSSTYEAIEGGTNIAWKITGDDNVDENTGEAYIQSNNYNVKVGVSNNLKFKFRYKVPAPVVGTVTAGGSYVAQTISIPYQKVRIRVTYGTNVFLTVDGKWTTLDNIITIYVTEFDKFLETEIVAPQPVPNAPNGYDLNVRIYHSYIYHAEYRDFDDLRNRDTYTASTIVLPTGTRTQSYDPSDDYLNYYELEENTDAESAPFIIRPNDYHVTNNPRQWVRKTRVSPIILTNSFSSPFWIDKVSCEFLTNGERSADTIVRDVNAESKNKAILEKEVTHGSYQNLITTIPSFSLAPGFGGLQGGSISLTTTNILSADILYAGYFRDADGVGYERWTRDGISEETSLHLILAQQMSVQYRRSWAKLTGSLYSPNRPFTFLDVFSMANDDDKKYLPVSGTIDEFRNRFTGEFLELNDISEGAGSDGGGSAPFSSGFTTGFGSGYN